MPPVRHPQASKLVIFCSARFRLARNYRPGAQFLTSIRKRLKDGLYLSICASDWGSHLESLAEGSAALKSSFELTEEPVPETIVVTVDDIVTTTGWTYAADAQSVNFDEDHIPIGGSVVELAYALAADCSG